MAHPKKFPILRSGQYAVLVVEGLTGIVLSVNGQWAIAEEERYRVCESLGAARRLAQALVAKSPQWECVIYDQLANHVESHRNMDAIIQATRRKSR